MIRGRGLWDKIDEVIWAVEGQPDSPGMQLATRHGIDTAPFFITRSPSGEERVYTSTVEFVKELAGVSQLGLAFGGAEDVALIDMAAKTGLRFSVFCLDTGRLHPETYRFIEKVREHYGIEIRLMSPDANTLEGLVRQKGLFSFYEDGHRECCGIRKVEPLGRALASYRAWATGMRRDQSPATRTAIPVVELDAGHTDKGGQPLVKLNPLSNMTSGEVWAYIRDNHVPHNELHGRGFISIGCEPCTRAVLPGEHERAGRWWWEDATRRECGLHVTKA